ncbi:MAG TPA: HAMP domain-containing histidine kinase [Candidatus Scatomorpha stercorigallinarum]|nr:HAMP domain-containing histidine kinase [Candidatus Scatomorpha stercorigallinarum]
MLKRMSRRFIGAAMAAITAVVLVLLCCLNLWNYRGVADQLDSTLDLLAAADGSWPDFALQQPAPPRGGGPFSGEMPYMIRFFAVHYDAGALAGGRTRGFYKGYRYLVRGDGGAKSVIFLNAERELGAVRSLLATTAAVAALCLAAVFILVLLLARRAVKPYMRNLEMQKQFITNAGHELKTPLTAISTSADVLALDLGDDEWVRNIQTQSARLSKLVAGLVTLSRLDEEDPLPEKARFSLSDALWEAADPFAPLIKAGGKSYSQRIEDGLTVTGDRAAVQQVVSILLDNAVKYSPEGGEISLRAFRSGRRAVIEVYNTCEGLDETDLERLFDRFYRADKSRSGAVKGSGIGFSIAKAAVEAHGGRIRAEKSAHGIMFQVTL